MVQRRLAGQLGQDPGHLLGVGLGLSTRARAFAIRDAAMSSIARVIFLMDCVDLIRRRSTRICAAMSPPLDLPGSARAAAGRRRPVDLDRVAVDLVLGQRVGLLLLGDDRRPVLDAAKLFLNDFHHALEPVDRPRSGSLPVSRISSRIPFSLRRRWSRNSPSKRRMSATGTESSWPEVPSQIETTSSATGNGEYCDCLRSSTSRSPRPRAAADAASRSEPNAANASSSRYCDRSSRSEPGHLLHRLDLGGATDPRHRDADVDRRPDALVEQVRLEEDLAVGDRDDVRRDVGRHVVRLGLDDRQTGHRAGAELVGQLRATLEQAGVQVEDVAGVGLAARRAAQQQRDRTVGLGLLGQVVEDDEDVLALVHPVLAERGARVGGDPLVTGRVRRRRRDDGRVLQRARLLQRGADAGDRGALLADRDVDAADLLLGVAGLPVLLLVDDRVDADGGLARLAVADDELALATPDRGSWRRWP